MGSLDRALGLSAKKIAAVYLAFGVTWILISDRLVELIYPAPSGAIQLQTAKGWIFVGLSAALIFGLVHLRERKLQQTKEDITTVSQRLEVLRRVLRHDIRNQLNLIKGYAEESSAHTPKERFEVIERAADSLIDMSEKLRIVDQHHFSDASKQTVDLNELVKEEVQRLQSSYPEATISVDLPESILVKGDESLCYVFREIFDNAMEHHTEPPAARRVTINGSQSESGVSLTIEDNGPGFSEEELAPLKQGQETQLSHASGVGLWLITWLCGIFDIDVRFESSGEDGTTVYLDFAEPETTEKGILERRLLGTFGS